MIKNCVISLGSNEASPACILSAHSALHSAFPDIRFSRLQQTLPIGCPLTRLFYNQVAVFTTQMSPSEIRAFLKRIEQAHGRHPEDKVSGVVKLDLDLLRYGGHVLKPDDWTRPYIKEGMAELSF